jgi:hypothetical protein
MFVRILNDYDVTSDFFIIFNKLYILEPFQIYKKIGKMVEFSHNPVFCFPH